jgi:hypothetical protein
MPVIGRSAPNAVFRGARHVGDPDRQGGPGGVNARILAKEAKADFRRVEAASLKMPTRFTSAEGKRFFARLFNTLQLNTHFISVIARTRLDHEDVAKIEEAIRAQMDAVTARTSTRPSTVPKRYSRSMASPARRPTTPCRWMWTSMCCRPSVDASWRCWANSTN